MTQFGKPLISLLITVFFIFFQLETQAGNIKALSASHKPVLVHQVSDLMLLGQDSSEKIALRAVVAKHPFDKGSLPRYKLYIALSNTQQDKAFYVMEILGLVSSTTLKTGLFDLTVKCEENQRIVDKVVRIDAQHLFFEDAQHEPHPTIFVSY